MTKPEEPTQTPAEASVAGNMSSPDTFQRAAMDALLAMKAYTANPSLTTIHDLMQALIFLLKLQIMENALHNKVFGSWVAEHLGVPPEDFVAAHSKEFFADMALPHEQEGSEDAPSGD